MKKTFILLLTMLTITSLQAQKNNPRGSQQMNKAGGGGGDETILTIDHCDLNSIFGTDDGDYINGVVLGTMENLDSGPIANDSSFVFYGTTHVARTIIGIPDTLMVQSGLWLDDHIKAWIDLNNDGEFSESESLGSSQLTGAANSWIAIPFTIDSEQYPTTAKLRISIYGETNDSLPCGSKVYGETEDYIISINDNPAPYCNSLSSYITTEGDYLGYANFGFSEFYGWGLSAEYQYISEVSAYGKQGDSSAFDFTFGEYNNDEVFIFIDYNQDLLFSSDEMVITFGNTEIFENISNSFVVPTDALTGLTRMRVMFKYGTAQVESCEAFSWGHTVDFNFYVHPALGAFETCYPTYIAGVQDFDYIQSFAFGDNIYTTSSLSANQPYYSDYSSQFSYAVEGHTYDVEIGGGNWTTDYYSLWIDFDQSSSLEESERLYQSLTSVADEVLMTTVTIPDDVEEGATLLRVQSTYDEENADPCGEYFFGEVEDYTLILTKTPELYCEAEYNYGNTDGDYISSVTLGDISMISLGMNQPYYHDYTDMSTTLETGSEQTIHIIGGDYSEDLFAVWIDYNQDNVFDESEKLGEYTVTTSFEEFDINFTIPADAELGETGMRVLCMDSFEGIATPCFTGDYGEYMDFTVNIDDDNGIENIANSPEFIVYPNPSQGKFTLKMIDNYNNGVVSIIDIQGKTIWTNVLNSDQVQHFDLDLAKGLYQIQVANQEGMKSKRLVIE